MKLAIDAMGGDNAPEAIVEGVIRAAKEFDDLSFVLVGDKEKLEPRVGSQERIEILHTTEKIEGTDAPVQAVRRKKQASMVLAVQQVREKRCAAAISAGNTGALMASGLFGVGRIKGIDRPALAPTLPTVDANRGFLFLDVGANAECRPENLLQYAMMGSIYAEKVWHRKNPKIGLLNIGTEPGKGNDLTKKAFQLLSEAPLNFIGNVESRELLQGAADVVVADGFSGNLVLKSIEGTAMSLMSLLKETLSGSLYTKVLTGLMYGKLKSLKTRMDYSLYGGALLFGLSAPVIKVHGAAKCEAVYTAIKQAKALVEEDIVGTIESTVLDADHTWLHNDAK
ncbi:phosphate acyltransferase PlsX [Sporolactobacillus spathodeae]|uniref:Phosphate acyltransferase n=1 Tax=Sporolactobacillus spathodeae TaxID=1465502 RepID=A0ABS2Q956_9BACL|nr:phosphate acyltransferase PlsX [Sporolactobacillus spathodeae]MBM7658186.1 glycerol-3-phosphate acyltransferase PlsX [Sporolactobacillus spathodeae]